MNFKIKQSKLTWDFCRKSTIRGVLAFLIISLMGVYFIAQRYKILKNNEALAMNNMLNIVRQNIDQSLKSADVSMMMAALTINDQGVPENFEEIAAKIIASNPNISSVQILPKGVVKYIYPLKGNETSMNLDVLTLPSRRVEALRSILRKKSYFAGPYKLIQGGMGIVGRFPVYKDNTFWGFSSVVIRLDDFLKTSGIHAVDDSKCYFQISKVNPITHREEFFLPSKGDFSSKRFVATIIPEGDWKLYLIAKNINSIDLLLVLPAVLFLLLAVLFGLFIYLISRKPIELQRLVEDKSKKLLSSEIKLETVFHQAAVGIAYVNSETGYYLEVNRQLCNMLGYSEQEMKEKTVLSITHPDDRQTSLLNLKKLKEGQIQEFAEEKRYMAKAGNIVWVNILVSPLRGIDNKPTLTNLAIIEDITAKKETEDKIIASQKKIENLINSIDGIVWECDYETFKLTFISNKTREITGYTPDEWMADIDFWEHHLHPEDKERYTDQFLNMSTEKEYTDFEYRLFTKAGDVIWIKELATLIFENQKPASIRGIMIDVTKTKEAEKDLQDSFDLVSEQNKRLLNFSYIVSHNLRSHTSNIQSISNLIETSESEDERQELLGLLKTVSNNLDDTMRNLNEVVNIQSNIGISVESLNLLEYIHKTTETLSDSIKMCDAEIINNVTDDVWINYNPAYLESILLNLVSNAIRYRHPERKPVITISYFTENNKNFLQVSDNGIGINLKRNGDKLFGMYKTFNGNPDARGIGLFITRNQIDAMGGNITVESEVNAGTTFKIQIK